MLYYDIIIGFFNFVFVDSGVMNPLATQVKIIISLFLNIKQIIYLGNKLVNFYLTQRRQVHTMSIKMAASP